MSTELKPLEEQSKDELAATIAAEQAKLNAAPPEEEKPAETPKFEFRSVDGTLYEAESQEELFKKISGALDHTKTAVKDRERQIHELRKQPVVEPLKPENAFDRDTWLKLMDEGTDGPLKAQRYMDKYRFGTENPEEIFKSMTQEQERAQQRDEAMRFYQTPAGQAFAKVETPELDKVMMDELAKQGLPTTASNLRAVYYELRESGHIPAPPEGKQATPKKAPPPSAHGTRNETTEEEPDFNRMTKTELAAYMRKQGMDVHVPN